MTSDNRFARACRGGESGFALLVVLIFVLVIGVVASYAVALGAAENRRSAEQVLLIEGKSFQKAFQAYYDATPPGYSHYPSKLEDLLLDPRYPDVRRYLRQIPPDPLTGKVNWVIISALEGGVLGVRTAFRGKPIKTSLFDPEFKTFEKAESYADWEFSAYASRSFTTTTGNLIFAPAILPTLSNTVTTNPTNQ